MDCCDNQEEMLVDKMYVCKNCGSMLDNIEFETTLFCNETRSNIRFNKFLKVVCTTKGLPWYVRNSMLDFFPKVERYFQQSERLNFINMNQLGREMCRVLGYPQYCGSFPPLKTKARVRQVGKFVDNACLYLFNGCENVNKMKDLPLKEITLDYEPDMTKVPLNNHVFTDKLIYAT